MPVEITDIAETASNAYVYDKHASTMWFYRK